MNDLQTIKEYYATAPDGLLISIAVNERDSLTAEARQILEAEISLRKLEMPVEEKQYSTGAEPVNQLDEIMQAILEMKKQNQPQQEIKSALLEGSTEENGLTEESINRAFYQVNLYINREIKKYELIMLTGTLIFFAGLAISFLPLIPETHRLVIILAYCAMIFGLIRFIHGILYRNRFKKMLRTG